MKDYVYWGKEGETVRRWKCKGNREKEEIRERGDERDERMVMRQK